MSASGTGEAAIFLRSGMASANPISATIPSAAELTTDQMTAFGTVTRALRASSDRSAASSKPTMVKIPIKAANGSCARMSLPVTPPVSNKKLTGWIGLVAKRMMRISATTTVPMISVNTATLLILAARATEMMLMPSGSAKSTSVMIRLEVWLVGSSPRIVAHRGDDHKGDAGTTDRQIEQCREADKPAVDGVHQAGAPLVRIAGQRHARAQLGDHQRHQQLPDAGQDPRPDRRWAEVGQAEAEVGEDPGGDRDDRERHGIEREELQRPPQLLPVSEGLQDLLVRQ